MESPESEGRGYIPVSGETYTSTLQHTTEVSGCQRDPENKPEDCGAVGGAIREGKFHSMMAQNIFAKRENRFAYEV